MTIWSADNHVRHPWFDHQVKKRRHATPEQTNTSSDECDAQVEQARATKRRRQCSVLERGLADLSLHHHEPSGALQNHGERCVENRVQAVSEPAPDSECAMDADDDEDDGPQVLLPGCIEEPEQDIPEIQMKTSSWYELSPDRIVITDLELFELEDDLGDENGGVEVNPSLLEHIKKQPSLVPPERMSQALVLFRPLPIRDVGPLKDVEETGSARQLGAEPMEVEI